MSLNENLKAIFEATKAGVHAELTAFEVKVLTEKVRQLEEENAKLRELVLKSSEINPYGSIENAEVRDMARALLYQVPALPINEEDERIVDDLVQKSRKYASLA